jgi:hypothetical protein
MRYAAGDNVIDSANTRLIRAAFSGLSLSLNTQKNSLKAIRISVLYLLVLV